MSHSLRSFQCPMPPASTLLRQFTPSTNLFKQLFGTFGQPRLCFFHGMVQHVHFGGHHCFLHFGHFRCRQLGQFIDNCPKTTRPQSSLQSTNKKISPTTQHKTSAHSSHTNKHTTTNQPTNPTYFFVIVVGTFTKSRGLLRRRFRTSIIVFFHDQFLL